MSELSNPDLPPEEHPLAIAIEARKIAREARADAALARKAVAGLAAAMHETGRDVSKLSDKVDSLSTDIDASKHEILTAMESAKDNDKRQATDIESQNAKLEAHTKALEANNALLAKQEARATANETRLESTFTEVTEVKKTVQDLSNRDVGKIAAATAAILTALAGAITLFAVTLAPVFASALPRIVESRYPTQPALTVSATVTTHPAPSASRLLVSSKSESPVRSCEPTGLSPFPAFTLEREPVTYR